MCNVPVPGMNVLTEGAFANTGGALPSLIAAAPTMTSYSTPDVRLWCVSYT